MFKLIGRAIMPVAFASAFGIAPACAADNNFYGVFSIGRANNSAQSVAVDNYNRAHGFGSSLTSSGSNTTIGKIQLGYNLGKTFALEGGYNYLGKIGFDSNTNLGAIHGNCDASLLNLDLVAKIPVGEQFSLLGRIGGYYWKTENDMPYALTSGTTKVNDNGTDFKAGLGMQYEFTPNFSLRLGNVAAALARAQIAALPERKRTWNLAYGRLAAALAGIDGLSLPRRPQAEDYVQSSIQFTVPGLGTEAFRAFLSGCAERGVVLKWFGAAQPHGYTSVPSHWGYLADPRTPPATADIVSRLCDMRIPLALSPAQCDRIAEIIADELRRARVMPAA